MTDTDQAPREFASMSNVCGKYTLLAKLGHGGMAEVFLGVSAGMAGFTKLLVIKRIHPQLMEEPEFLTMFLDEARLAARLNHPNIVHTLEVSQSADGLPFMAMEYLEGQSVDKLIRQARRTEKPLPRDIGLAMVARSLEGLHYAHTATDYDGSLLNVVHRDISPSNLFVTYQGAVKVLDFGIAKAGTQIAVTRTGRIKGKLSYMAPEQAKSQKVDGRADVWSMGVTLWEMLAGQRLFKEADDIATLQRVITADIPPIREAAPGHPEALYEVVDKALAAKVDERFESADAMRKAIEEVAATDPDVTIASQSDIADYVGSLFEEVRKRHTDRIRRTLEGHMAAPERQSLPTLTQSSPSKTGPNPVVGEEDPTINVVSGTHGAVNPASRLTKIGLGVAAFLVIVLLGLLTFEVFGSHERDEMVAVAEPPPVVEAPTVAADPVEEPDPEPPSPAERVPADFPTPTAEVEPAPEVEPEPASASMRPRMRRPRMVAVAMDTPTMEAEPEVRPTPAVPTVTGTLSLVTTPWSEVRLGSRRLGTTPLIGISLPVGSHMLTLRNSEEELETRYRVVIREGEHTRARISLR